jgi:transposase
MTTIISPYDIERTQHKQYDGLSFIDCRLLDQRQAEEQANEEQRIKASDRTDWQAICVKAGFPLDAHEMFRPNSADRGLPSKVSGVAITFSAPKAGVTVIRQVKDGYQLTDAEWAIVAPCIPVYQNQTVATARERLFLDGVFWSLEAASLGLSWNYLPPEHDVRRLQERLRRWNQKKLFNAMYDRLIITSGLSDTRLEGFKKIADNEVETARAMTLRKHAKAAA